MDEKKEKLEVPGSATVGGAEAAASSGETEASAASEAAPAAAGGGDLAPGVIEELIVEQLRTVYDPEIPVNIYDLGLIYHIAVQEGGDVAIKMTLTAPGCPVAGEMPGMVEMAARRVDAVVHCDVELLWDPPWNPDMMSEEARLTLNI